jgi:ketosteroid isomerase-like protein
MKGDLDEFLARYHDALDEFMRGNFEPARQMWSERDDITLGNPFGPFARGMTQVVEAMERGAANYRDGRAIEFDGVARHLAGDLAVVVEVERLESVVRGGDDLRQVDLRVTSVLRNEDGRWRLLHRHADPITTIRGSESILGSS